MLKSHEKFHSANGKRLILVADDELINRELLGLVLQSDYEVIYAADGRQTVEKMRQTHEQLSLVLMDLNMPVMGGLEVLRQVRKEPDLARIPIIVLTSDQEAEVESLSLGAIDFIPKPYPQAGVMLARILRTIELSEDRQIINSTERDPLTGLYNREYFYRYAEQFDHHHRDMEMDAVVVDINHFHMINERFGTGYGDNILRRIGESMRQMVQGDGGIVCRREADTFMVYCPHGRDWRKILDKAAAGLSGDITANNRVRLRMGIYENVDKTLEIERRFDRAKMAADTVRGSFANNIGIYDSLLHERELYSERLIEDFYTAIEENQFRVFYQPKFDVRPEVPVLASAEALVRWFHPTLGMISPGAFIPLFEENGLIQTLDHYVWAETAARIRDWRDRFGITLPVSVNVSRIDMYDPRLVETFQEILEKNGLAAGALLLEITESAYTQDSEQIIDTVNRLRSLGFRIEMDDFGTGYSSLNMISTLPIDALKLDMQFIRNAFNGRRDTRMLEVILEIADYLSVPVIAEGVETEDQLSALRAMGCDLVQGYYFSKPVPPEEYEQFVADRAAALKASGELASDRTGGKAGTDQAAAQETSEGTTTGRAAADRTGRKANADRAAVQEASEGKNAGRAAADRIGGKADADLAAAQENLEEKAAAGLTGPPEDLMFPKARWEAPETRRQRRVTFARIAEALSRDYFSIYYVDTDTGRFFEYSAHKEYKKLGLAPVGDDFFSLSRENIRRVIYPEDQTRFLQIFTRERVLEELAQNHTFTMTYRLLFDGEPTYVRMKATRLADPADPHIVVGVNNVNAEMIRRREMVTYAGIAEALAADYFSIYYVDTETDRFIEYSSHEEYQQLGIEKEGERFFDLSRENVRRAVHPDDVGMVLDAFQKEKILAQLREDKTFTLTYRLLFGGEPTYVHMKATRMADPADPHIVIGVSNIDEQIRREQEHSQAVRAVNRDPLTGVKSKHAYTEAEKEVDAAIAAGRADPFAVALCDLNGLKHVNDTRGHKAGDLYLRDGCLSICHVFKHSPVYRIGGDEFVAILRGSDYEARSQLLRLLEEKNAACRSQDRATIAAGLSKYRPGEDHSMAAVFERADARMYENKKRMKE